MTGVAPAIEAVRLSRWFGNLVAVNDVSFSLTAGITGLLGPNGAGKSTLLHMLSGFLKPSSGELRVLGQPSWRNPAIYRSLGIVPEHDALYPFLTGYQFALLNARLFKLPDPAIAAAAAIERVGLVDVQHRAVGGYSKGMRQRLKVAAAVVHDPPILLLDEPFNGVDPAQRLHMIDLLDEMAAQGRTILVSSHVLEEVERLAQRILVIVSGRLAASGDFREIRRLMTDRPHTFTVRSSDDRRLAAALVNGGLVFGVELLDGRLSTRSLDFEGFTNRIARVARDEGISLYELYPADESLESVFSYLVRR